MTNQLEECFARADGLTAAQMRFARAEAQGKGCCAGMESASRMERYARMGSRRTCRGESEV